MFLITTYHPNDQTARDIARGNWDILGQSPTTEGLYNKKLTMGYRRPKNLSDLLVRASIDRITGDETVDPHFTVGTDIVQTETATEAPVAQRQRSIRDFFAPSTTTVEISLVPPTVAVRTPIGSRPEPRKGTNPAKRGLTSATTGMQILPPPGQNRECGEQHH